MREGRKILFIIMSLFVIFGALPLHAENMAKTLTLSEALKLASERDVRLIIAQERVVQALARLGQNRSVLFPQLNISASENRQTRDLRTAGINLSGDPLVGPFNVFDARARITQTIFDSSAMARFKSAQAGHELSMAELHKIQEDVLVLVATIFLDAQRSAQSVEYVQALINKEEKALAIAQSQKDLGISSDVDVKKAQASYNTAMRLFNEAKAHATESRLDLLTALGWDVNTSIQFLDDDGLNFPIPQEDYSLDSVEHLPEMAVARGQLTLDKSNLNVEKAGYWPKISMFADYGPSGVDPTDQNETYTLGVQASWPILDGGLRKYSKKEAESRVRESEAALQDTQRQSQSKILNALESFHQAQALAKEKESQHELSKQQLLLAQQRKIDGSASDLEVLDAMAQEAGAHDQENEARAALLTAQINWVSSVGRMNDFLKREVSSLDSKGKNL